MSRVWHSDGERRAEIAHAPSGRRSCLSSQSVTNTLLAGISWITHTLLFFSFECGDNLCIFVFIYFSLVFRQGPHFRMMFFSLRFSPLLLVVDLDENGPRR